MKTIFMGTPDFSVYIANALRENEFDIQCVVTQPDKESGRGKKIHYSPIKEWAIKNNIEILQPIKAKDSEFIEKIKSLKPELIVTAAFGQIIPIDILEIPTYGCINVHASLLPKYRGASPIQQSLFDGEKETGITIMYMNEKMDEGDIILQRKIEILPSDNTGSLFDKLAKEGALAIIDYKKMLENGKPVGFPQNSINATYCKKISKEQGNIDWNKSAQEIFNCIRAMTPYPGAYSFLSGKRIKIISVTYEKAEHDFIAGKIISANKNEITVSCKDGFIKILSLQPEGKNILSAKDFLNGHKLTAHEAFERKI